MPIDGAESSGIEPFVEFTDREIRLIAASLPDADPRRLTLLPDILREWAGTDLREHFARARPTSRERRRLMGAVGRRARELTEALAALDRTAQTRLAIELARAPGEAIPSVSEERFAASRLRLDEEPQFLADLVGAADRASASGGPGRPRNIVAYLVMTDLAAIFEFVTGADAMRRVERSDGEEAGPFWGFVAAVWPVVFRAGDSGIPAAMKAWASARAKYGEDSPVIANIALRHPTWRIFD